MASHSGAHIKVALAIQKVDRLLWQKIHWGLRPYSELESVGQLSYCLGSPLEHLIHLVSFCSPQRRCEVVTAGMAQLWRM